MTFTARVPARLAFRDVVGDMVRGVCRQIERVERCNGLEWRVISAFNEAFNNVAEHAYEPQRVGDVVVIVRADSARLEVEVADEGRGFDFGVADGRAMPPLEGLDDGGMGLFIIGRAVSHVHYERGAPNRLTMVQELSECRAGLPHGAGSNDEG